MNPEDKELWAALDVTLAALKTAREADANVVTDDISTTKPDLARGVAVGTIEKGSFGWIQTWGAHNAVKTDGEEVK